MNQRHIALSIGIIVLIIIGMFGFAHLKMKELTQEKPNVIEEKKDDSLGYIAQIDAKHFFENGVHTLVGEILMPTPCDLLNWDSPTVAESYPEQVTVHFSVVNDTEMCAQVMTPQRFKVSFSASKDATIRATLNGVPRTLNLIPPLEGESPESFELFIKG